MSTLNVDIIQNAAGTGSPTFPFGFTGNSTANIRSSEGSGTTTLTASDNPVQVFNLSAARTVVLPTTSIPAGYTIRLENRTDFTLTVQSSDTTELTASNLGAAVGYPKIKKGYMELQALQATPTAPSHWRLRTSSSSTTLSSISSGDFTAGTFEVSRSDDVVTGFVSVSITHSSSSTPLSATGFIPDWARPVTAAASNLGTFAASFVARTSIDTTGQLAFVYLDWAGAGTNRTSTLTGHTISFVAK